MTPILLVRCQWGASVGLGHLSRCTALAEAWKRLGGQVHLVRGVSDAPLPEATATLLDQLHTLDGGGGQPHRRWQRLAQSVDPAWVVVDGYHFTPACLGAIRHAARRLLMIQDRSDCDDDFGADVLLRPQALCTSPMPVAGQMQGPRFILLRDQFCKAAQRLRPIASTVKRVLITFGGSDVLDLTPAVVESVRRAARSVKAVDVLVGPYQRLPVVAGTSAAGPIINVIQNPPAVCEWMQRADLAVSAGGSTSYELACLGIPSLLVPVVANQQPVVAALHHAGACAATDIGTVRDTGRLAQRISRLADDLAERRRISQNGRNLVDGRGARRVATHMMGQLINLRPATRNDAKLLWNWRFDPAVRASSFAGDPPGWHAHTQWVEQQIRSSHARLWIAELRGEPIGQVRLDKGLSGEAEISLSLDSQWRGRRLGLVLIERAVQVAGASAVATIVAHVKPQNLASIRTFEESDFLLAGKTTLHGQAALRYSRPVVYPEQPALSAQSA